jgi:hypothetical protein
MSFLIQSLCGLELFLDVDLLLIIQIEPVFYDFLYFREVVCIFCSCGTPVFHREPIERREIRTERVPTDPPVMIPVLSFLRTFGSTHQRPITPPYAKFVTGVLSYAVDFSLLSPIFPLWVREHTVLHFRTHAEGRQVWESAALRV